MAQSFDIVGNLILKTEQAEAGVGKLRSSLSRLKLPTDIGNDLRKSFSNLDGLFAKFKSQIQGDLGSKKAFSELTNTTSQIDREVERIYQSFGKLNSTNVNFKIHSEEITNTEKELERLIQLREKLGSETSSGISGDLAKLEASFSRSKVGQNLFADFKKTLASGDIDAAKDKLGAVITQFNKLKTAKDALKNSDQVFSNITSALDAAKAKLDSTDGEFSNLSVMIKQVAQSLGLLRADEIAKLDSYLEKTTAVLEKTGSAARSAANEGKELGASMSQAGQEISDLQSYTQYFFSLRNMLFLLKRGFDDAIESVKNLDKAMTETAVVTEHTVGDMWKMLPEYTARANELGATIQDMYEATTLYYQQGLNADQAMSIATETMKMARIGGLEAANATDMMTAALRGFNMELNEASAQRINDVYSNLAAKTASNTKELGTAMQRTASIAASAGMSFEGTSAFLAQAIETTREPAENLGTAMKTIVARFTELKKNPLEMTEVDGEEVSYNKVDTALQSIGVSLKDANGQFRALDQVFLDISQRWDSLTQTQQRYVATTAAGSRQQSRFIAMMDNYERTMQLMDYANNSEGASEEQFGKTMESFEAKANRLKNAWDQFLMGLADNSIIKGTTDALTFLLDKFTALLDKVSFGISPLKSVLSLFAAFAGIKMGGRIVNSFIGGIGGMLDPNSSWSAGIKTGAIGSRSGGNPTLAAQISNPIVAAIKEAKGQLGAQFGNSAREQWLGFKNARVGMKDLSSGTFSVKDIREQLSGLNYGNQEALMKSFSGTAMSMRGAIMDRYYQKAGGNSEATQAIRQAEKNIANARKAGKISWEQYWDAISNEKTMKEALNKKEPGYKAASAMFDDINKAVTEKGQAAYKDAYQKAIDRSIERRMNGVRTDSDGNIIKLTEEEARLEAKNSKRLQQVAKARAEQARAAAEEEARQGITTSNNKTANFANRIGNIGGAVGQAGLGLQMLASTLLNSTNPAVQAFGTALSSVGGTLYGVGLGVSGLSSAFTSLVESQFMINTAESLSTALGGVTITAGALTGVLAAAVAAIGLIIFAIKKHHENIKKAAEKVTTDYKEANDEAQSNITKLEEGKSDFERLQKGVDENGNNVSLDSADYEKYKELVNTIAELNPSIVEGYNAQGDAIIKNNEALEKTIALQRQLQKEAAEEYTSSTSLAKLIRARDDSNDYDKDISQSADTSTKINSIVKSHLLRGTIFEAWNKIKEFKSLSGQSDWYLKKLYALSSVGRIDADKVKEKFGIDISVQGMNDPANLKLVADKIDLLSSYVGSLDLSDKELNTLSKTSDSIKDGVSKMNDQVQPIYELLSTYATEQGFENGLPDEYKPALQEGLRSIAESGKDSDTMFAEVKGLYRNFKDVYGSNSKMADAKEKARVARETYDKDLNEEKYLKAIRSTVQPIYDDLYKEYLKKAEDTGDESYAIMAEAIRNDYLKYEDIAQSATNTLATAFDGLASHVDAAAEAAKEFSEISSEISPDRGTEALKPIYDEVFDEEDTHALLHDSVYWKGAESFINKDLLRKGDVDKIDPILKKIGPTLEKGIEGVRATTQFLWDMADNDYIKALPDGNIEVNIDTEEDLNKYAEKKGLNADYVAALLERLGPLGIRTINYDSVRDVYASDERVKKGPETENDEDRHLLISEENVLADARDNNIGYDEFNKEILPKLKKQNVDVLPSYSDENKKEIKGILDSYNIDDKNYIEELIDVIPKEEIEKIGQNLYGDNLGTIDERYDEELLNQDNSLDKYRNDILTDINSTLKSIAKLYGIDTDPISKGEATQADLDAYNYGEALFGENGTIRSFLKGEYADGQKFESSKEAKEFLETQIEDLSSYRTMLEKGLQNTTDPQKQKIYQNKLDEIDGYLFTLQGLQKRGIPKNLVGAEDTSNLLDILEKYTPEDFSDATKRSKFIKAIREGAKEDAKKEDKEEEEEEGTTTGSYTESAYPHPGGRFIDSEALLHGIGKLLGFTKPEVGNTDLYNRPVIDWGEDPTKNSNYKAAKTWGYTAEDLKNTKSTYMSSAMTFGEGDNAFTLTYTPVLPDGTVLDKDTTEKYVNDLVGQSTNPETGEVDYTKLFNLDKIGTDGISGLFMGAFSGEDGGIGLSENFANVTHMMSDLITQGYGDAINNLDPAQIAQDSNSYEALKNIYNSVLQDQIPKAEDLQTLDLDSSAFDSTTETTKSVGERLRNWFDDIRNNLSDSENTAALAMDVVNSDTIGKTISDVGTRLKDWRDRINGINPGNNNGSKENPEQPAPTISVPTDAPQFNVDTSPGVTAVDELQDNVDATKASVEEGAVFNLNVSGGIRKLTKAATAAEKITKNSGNKSISVTADGEDKTNKLTTAVKDFAGLKNKYKVNTKVDVDGLTDLKTAISKVNDFYDLRDDTVTLTTKHRNDNGKATGAHNHGYVSAPPKAGSAARGSYGQLGPKGKGGMTLTGELGYEIAWIPSENRSMILGANGPQMVDLPGDAVVWTHEQSKKIMKQNAIPAGSHAGAYAKGTTDLSLLDGGGGGGSGKNPNKGKTGNGKGKGNGNKVTVKIGKVSVWWENQTRKIDATQRAVDKALKKFEKEIATVGKTRQNLNDTIKAYRNQLKKSINLNKQSLKAANKALNKLDTDKKASKHSITYKKGKKDVPEKVSLSGYIKKDKATGTYVIDQAAINKAAAKNKNRAKAIKEAAEKEINEKLSKRNTALNNIEKAQEALAKLNDDIYKAFHGWEKSITKIYFITQKLDALSKRLSIGESRTELEYAKLEAGVGTAGSSLSTITSMLQQERDLMLSQAQGQYSNVLAAEEEFKKSLDFTNYLKDTVGNKDGVGSAEAANDAAAARIAFDILERAKLADGSFDFSAAIKWLEDKNYDETTYNAVKEVLDKIAEKQSNYYDALNDAYSIQTEIYQKIEEYQAFISEFEQDLLTGIEEQAENEIRHLDKLNSSLTKAYKDLLDEVKQKLTERRNKEDNAKTEFEISQKQQRLAMLRADTSGGHQVVIAQLQKELDEAKQNYQRTLEDQLLEKLQQQGDEAEKQRQRQIELLEVQKEIARETGTNLAEVKKWLEDPTANYEDIKKAWLANKNYDEATPDQQIQLEEEFESNWAKYRAYSKELPNYVSQAQQSLSNLETKVNTIADNLLDIKASNDAKLMYDKGISAKVLHDAGYGAKSLKEAGYKDTDIKKAGYTAAQFRDVTGGKTLKSAVRALKAGYSLKEVTSAYGGKLAAEAAMVNKNKSGTAVQGTTGLSAKALQQIVNKSSKDNAKQSDMANVQGGKVDVNGSKKGGVIKDSHLSSAGTTIGSNKGSTLYTADWDEKTGKVKGGWTPHTIDKLTANLIKKYPIDGKQALEYAIKNTKVGSKINKNFGELVKAAGIAGKTYKLKNGTTASIGGGGNIHYNGTKKKKDGVYVWNPSTGKISFREYKKNDFIKWAADKNTGREYKAVLKKKGVKGYATGGLADYTGPAWLDGTPSKPELVLNATDTKNFLALRDVLSRAISSTGAVENTYGGDTTYEININVDKIEKDYDVDRVIEKVKKEITKGAGYRNVTQVRNFR